MKLRNLKKFKNQLTFGAICYAIENQRTDSGESLKLRINDAKDFFEDITKGLETLLDNRHYSFKEDVNKVIRICGYESGSREKIKSTVRKFKITIGHLLDLRDYPEKFYETVNSKKLYNICKNLEKMNTENIRVFHRE